MELGVVSLLLVKGVEKNDNFDLIRPQKLSNQLILNGIYMMALFALIRLRSIYSSPFRRMTMHSRHPLIAGATNFAGVLALTFSAGAVAVPAPIDLSPWTVIQYEFNDQPNASWVLSNGNTTASQVLNADASILLSNFDAAGQQIAGSWPLIPQVTMISWVLSLAIKIVVNTICSIGNKLTNNGPGLQSAA